MSRRNHFILPAPEVTLPAMTCALIALLVMTFGCARDLPEDTRADVDTAMKIREAFAGDAVAGGPAEVLADPTGYATFSGVFRVEGTVPPQPPLAISGDDASVCAPGARSPLARSIAVGSGGALANVLVYLDMDIPLDDERWIHPSFAETADAEVPVEAGFDQKECVFLTRVYTMRASQTIKIVNSDPVGHNTNIDASGKARFNQLIPANSAIDYAPQVATKGARPVSCNIHPWMRAYIYISEHPYYAVTDSEGKFEIANLPAGVELTFRVWQENLNNVQQVKVGMDGASPSETKWSKGKFTTTLTADQPSTMDVVIDASTFK